MKLISSLIKLMRPGQWIKNGFVLMPLVFSGRLFCPYDTLKALGVFISFCLAASATYVINDYMDMDQDRIHPLKRNRPLASGAVIAADGIGPSCRPDIVNVYQHSVIFTAFYPRRFSYLHNFALSLFLETQEPSNH